MNWLQVSNNRKKIIITQVANNLGLPPYAVEKDWSDPQIVELNYVSLFEQNNYLPQRVLIEVGARSLREPAENRFLQSFIGQNFNQSAFADAPFPVLCVNPQRTFIEKVLLLHEIFLKETDNIRPNRMSRHLYDIHKMMDTDFGLKAVKNKDLFQIIGDFSF